VLEAMPKDEQVQAYLAGVGSCYVADSDGYRRWLRRIAERVQQRLAP
jgi:hypothetical protein